MSQPAKKLRIVMCEALPWDCHTKVGSHHYAETLSELGHSVFWLSHDIHWPAILQGKHSDHEYPFRSTRACGPGNKLTHWHPTVPFPFRKKRFFDNKFFANANAVLAQQKIRKKIHQSGFKEPDILWLSQSYSAYLASITIKSSNVFFRMSDHASHFSEFPNTYTELEQLLMKRADSIGVTTTNLQGIIPHQYHQKIIQCPNGVRTSLFTTNNHRSNRKRRRIVFTGTIGSWIDFKLLNRATEVLNEDYFYIYGPLTTDASKIEKRSNIYFKGAFNYSELPKILQEADIGLIPFNLADPIANYANPLKAWEYLAAGLPVVSTRLPCFSSTPEIHQAATHQEFIDLLSTVEPHNHIHRRREVAEQYDWERLTLALLNKLTR